MGLSNLKNGYGCLMVVRRDEAAVILMGCW